MTRHELDHEVELYREDDAYVVLVEMPGYDRGDLDLTWRDNHLHIEARHVDEETGRSQVYQRNMSFPRDIDESNITANKPEDTLEVRLPIAGEVHEEGIDIDIE